jgi:hypothetical protein
MGVRTYRVVIPYREPTFNDGDGIYEGTFEIEARSARQAKELAVEEFRRTADESLVQWKREIIPGDIRVEFAGRSIAEIQAKESSLEEAYGGP